jgi:hypothetical protein
MLYSIDAIPVKGPLASASLDTRALEEILMEFNGGIDLAEFPNHGELKVDAHPIIPFYLGENELIGVAKEELLQPFRHIRGPCSLAIGTEQELYQHMFNAYQVAHFHYILGKAYDMNESFPQNCCGSSSRNVMLSLLKHGYTPICSANTESKRHTYLVMPFVMPDFKGVIVIDPTSDQLWDKRPKGKIEFDFQAQCRNAVFVKEGSAWEYNAYWGDLFPERVLDLNRYRINDDWYDYYNYHQGGQKFFNRAFKNPVRVKPQ